ncbi:MAG: excinuclease ABC subunit UvrC [Oligoflexia bacterium]|nr:excinuclease ABC subunit UvrC [Oligoflexia bacterium]
MLDLAHAAATSPGVYLMKGPQGEIIYVGKAKNLRNRLTTYFQPAGHENPRTEMMVGRVQRFDVILTETEAEALILECTLIKKHKPKFNVRLKDDKAYPYLRIQLGDAYPRLEYVRRVQRDGARYFGPFPSAWAARQVMDLLVESFHLRDCSDNAFRHRTRPCILHQMGKCTAACVGKIDQNTYREQIDEVIAILEGRGERLTAQLRKGMEDASEREEFEEAAYYRDQLRNLEVVTQTQGVHEAGSQRDRDVAGLSRKGSDAHGTLLRIRGGRMIAVQHYHLQNTDPALSDAEILRDFLSQYYVDLEQRVGKGEEPGLVPSEVLVPLVPAEFEIMEKTLAIGIRQAETAVDRQLLNVARSNADYALEQLLKRSKGEGGHGLEALEEAQDKLHLPKLPHRIECYDISNLQGQDAVASRVVFVDGAPDKNLYRRYKIKTVEGANDFAMMKEVLGRRFSHADEALPDLVVVDGGKGQLAQAVAILEELEVQGVSVVGLAKARVESDFRATEVKSSHERIFIPNRKNPVPLLPHTAAYRLLTHVRDEAHRFAVSYHRLLRDKRSLGKSGN